MKKIICWKCGEKRGRRQCPKLSNRFICGDCCSNIQIGSGCPKDCIHLGKLNTKDLDKRIRELLDTGAFIQDKNPHEAIKIYDRILELDNSNAQAYIGKSAAYSNMGRHDDGLECLKKAFELKNDPNICINIAAMYRKQNRFHEAMDVLDKIKERFNGWKYDYLMGDCLFMSGRYEKAIGYLENVIKDPLSTKEYKNRARVILSRIFIYNKDYDRSMGYAVSIDDEYRDEKTSLIENIYFAGGRMYELLDYINSMDKVDFNEKYMLLQCALVLKKNTRGSIVSIIDDLLSCGYFGKSSYEEANLAGLKIILLFKELKINEAYDVFKLYYEKIINNARHVENCSEACHLIAFFLYNIDRKSSIEIYAASSSMSIDDFIVAEFYNAFASMDIPPYIKAKSIERSIDMVSKGKGDSFNRTAIAADIFYELGDYSPAYEMYSRLIDVDRPDMMLMNKMAACLVKQNKFDEALELYNKIISFTRFIPSAYSGAIRCCIELNIEWSGYFKCLELEKLNFNEMYELAASLMNAECFDKAGYIYSYILDKFSSMDIYSRKMIYHNLAEVYRNLKEYDKGIEIINRISTKYMGEDLLVDLGCLYHDSCQYLKAKDVFEGVLKIKETPIVLFNLGILSMKLNEYENALEYFAKSKRKVKEEAIDGKYANPTEYSSMMKKLYKNISLCLLNLKRHEEALSFIERAGKIDMDDKIAEITFAIQGNLLNMSRGVADKIANLDHLIDGCITINEGFTDGIRHLLDDVLYKVYGKKDKRARLQCQWDDDIASFLRNEKRIYKKYRDSYERSEGTFQRYVDNFMSSFEKRITSKFSEEAAAALDGTIFDSCLEEYCADLTSLGDRLFDAFEFEKEEYIYTALIPYFKTIKLLCRSMLYPYYKKNIDMLPTPSTLDEFKDIGVFCYKTGDEVCYRVDFSFNISCSQYLFEINCHPGLRSKYLDCNRHYMPWNKLMWVISGIRKKWDVLDDARSAGLLLLFYCGYRNYLGIDGEFQSSDDYIVLAGDLIHISNERDFLIRSMLNDDFEFDCTNYVREIREIALKCIGKLKKIKRME